MADDAFISRPGSVNDTTPNDETLAGAIFLKQFGGDVIDAFDEYNVMAPLVAVRQVANQKSAAFPLMGRAAAQGHLPALDAFTNLIQDASLQRIKHAEKEIFIDGPIIAQTALHEFDDLRSHWDVRSMHAQELGRALSEEYDRRALIMGFKGAASASLVTAGGPDNDRGGSSILDADWESNGASAAASFFAAMTALDNKFVPRRDRHGIVTPTCYGNLAQQTDLINRDWGGDPQGSYADGTVEKISGFQLHVSARVGSLGNIDAAAVTGDLNDYTVDLTNRRALLFHKSGVGAVQLKGMSMESAYMIEYQSWLFVAKKICGFGFLRPESLVEIRVA